MPYALVPMPISLRTHLNRRRRTQWPAAEGGLPATIFDVGNRGRVTGRTGLRIHGQ